ncbi:variable large family protein (plasmid) [Borrelia turicatae 91E135]|nr:variable large family protein [Borrelia turicatae 91E135]UPA14327.1 variable large family protein [Borrelia turicatae 91E135]
MSFAKGGNTADNLAQDAVKAAVVAGGIALRSLVKNGKLASGVRLEGNLRDVPQMPSILL